MSKFVNIALVAGAGLYVILWFGGIVSSALWDEVPEGTEWAAPTFLYIASAIVLIRLNWRNRVLFTLIGLYGFGAEVLGESTGFPFGDYSYTDTLGPALWDVPIALASAWIVITAFVANVLMRLGVPHRWWLVAGPVAMVATDLLLEPVAAGPMDAWVWESSGGYYGVPLMNFIGWFVVSLPIFGLLTASRFTARGGALIATSVIAFFLLIALFNLLWWPLAITASAVVMYLLWRRDCFVNRSTFQNFGQPERS